MVLAASSTGVPPYNPMHTDQTYNQYQNQQRVNTQVGQIGAPNLSQADPLDMLKSLLSIAGLGGSGASSAALQYMLLSPQEMAQRGLDINSLQQQVLNGQQGYIGAQQGQNSLFNQIAAAQLGRQSQQADLQAAQDRHTAQGQFAAQGSISSEAARQQLGNSYTWADPSVTPWRAPGGIGDIEYQRQNTQKGLYEQLLQQNSQYNLKNMDLYNQLLSLAVQQGQLGQSNDVYNRLLGGNYNKAASPDEMALYYALTRAT